MKSAKTISTTKITFNPFLPFSAAAAAAAGNGQGIEEEQAATPYPGNQPIQDQNGEQTNEHSF